MMTNDKKIEGPFPARVAKKTKEEEESTKGKDECPK